MNLTAEDKFFALMVLGCYGFVFLGIPAILLLSTQFSYWMAVWELICIGWWAPICTVFPYILVTRFSK